MKEKIYFSSNLKYLRQLRGLTQGQLGDMISVDQTTIGRWEDGNREPTIGNVLNISKIFDIDINELLNKDLRQNGMNDIIDFGNNIKLLDAIGSFADGRYAQLLAKCTTLTPTNRDKVLELVDMYLKNQDNFYTDENGDLVYNGSDLHDKAKKITEQLKKEEDNS